MLCSFNKSNANTHPYPKLKRRKSVVCKNYCMIPLISTSSVRKSYLSIIHEFIYFTKLIKTIQCKFSFRGKLCHPPNAAVRQALSERSPPEEVDPERQCPAWGSPPFALFQGALCCCSSHLQAFV